MKIVVYCNPSKPKTRSVLPEVMKKLEEMNLEVIYNGEVQPDTDLIITVGGDGTILRQGKLAAEKNKPLLGINTGRLGFMATLECTELHKLKKLINKEYSISRRIMMDIKIKDRKFIGLNDVVFVKGLYKKLPEFKVSCKGSEVVKIRADGIIFSTPTGSTAYALSAGGPIMEPELECIEFTPLCAHTLFGRPMILSGDEPIKIRYESYEGSNVFVSVDGIKGIPLSSNDYVTISKSEKYLDLIDIDGNSFYKAVHSKLMRPLK